MHVAVFVIRKAATRVGNLHVIHGDGIALPRRRRWRSLGIGTRDGNLAGKLERRERRASVTRCQRANGLDRILIGRELSVPRDNSAELTSKYGFSVVAPIIMTVRFSTACSSASC